MGAQLHQIGRHRAVEAATCELDVVFVHGLGGHPFETWRHGDDESTSWPHWLAKEYGERVAVWSFGYPASKSMLPRLKELVKKFIGRPYDEDAGYSMPLTDRARNALNIMVQQGVGQRPCVFIVHSLGGLLVKYLLNLAHDEAQSSRQHALISNCKAILFLATPHQGSNLASLLREFRIYFPTITIDELKDNDSHLRMLYQWYRKQAPQFHIDTRSFYESRGTAGVVVVVKPDSADPGTAGKDPIPHDADHLSIACPKRWDDPVVLEARELIESQLRANSTAVRATVFDGSIPDPFASSDFHLKVSVEETVTNKLQLLSQPLADAVSLSCRVRCSLYQGQVVLDLSGINEAGFLTNPFCFTVDDPSPLIDQIKQLLRVALNNCQVRLGDNLTPLRLRLHLMLPVTWLSGPLPETIQMSFGRQVFFGCSKRAELAESAVTQLRSQAMQVNQRLHSGGLLSSLNWATVCNEAALPIAFDQLFQPSAQVIHLNASSLDSEARHCDLVGRDALLASEHTLLFVDRLSSTGKGLVEASACRRWLRLVEIGMPLVLWWRDGTESMSQSFERLGRVLDGSWSNLCEHLELLVMVLNSHNETALEMRGLMAKLGIFYEEPLRCTRPDSYRHPLHTPR